MIRLAPWLVVFALYAAVPTVGAGDYGRGEPRYVATAAAIAHGRPAPDRRGIGFSALLAAAWTLDGRDAAELLVAALAALAFGLGAVLARRIAPEPWATLTVLAFALSPPALAYASRVHAELPAAAMLTGALLLALRSREDPRPADVMVATALLAALPWLGTSYVIGAVPVLAALAHWTMRHGRRVLGLLAVEIVAASVVVLVSVPGTSDLSAAAEHVGEGYRLAVWTPVLLLAAGAAWIGWHSWRDLLARALPGRREVEVTTGLALATCAACVLHPAVALPCAAAASAWSFQRAHRIAAALAILTVGASVFLLLFPSN